MASEPITWTKALLALHTAGQLTLLDACRRGQCFTNPICVIYLAKISLLVGNESYETLLPCETCQSGRRSSHSRQVYNKVSAPAQAQFGWRGSCPAMSAVLLPVEVSLTQPMRVPERGRISFPYARQKSQSTRRMQMQTFAIVQSCLLESKSSTDDASLVLRGRHLLWRGPRMLDRPSPPKALRKPFHPLLRKQFDLSPTSLNSTPPPADDDPRHHPAPTPKTSRIKR